MDPFATFFTPSLLFYSFAIFAVSFVIRTIVEYFLPKSKASNVWNSLFLPLLPVLIGGVTAVFAKMYPDPLGASIFAREVYGLTAGLLSGLIYKMLKGYLKTQFPSISLVNTPVISDMVPSPNPNVQMGMSNDVHPK